jgi:hypothetical protein
MVIGEAFQAVNGEVVAGAGAGAGATALVALVLERYIVIAKCGGGSSKAVLSRGGQHVELTPDRRVKFFLLSPFSFVSSRVCRYSLRAYPNCSYLLRIILGYRPEFVQIQLKRLCAHSHSQQNRAGEKQSVADSISNALQTGRLSFGT